MAKTKQYRRGQGHRLLVCGYGLYPDQVEKLRRCAAARGTNKAQLLRTLIDALPDVEETVKITKVNS